MRAMLTSRNDIRVSGGQYLRARRQSSMSLCALFPPSSNPNGACFQLPPELQSLRDTLADKISNSPINLQNLRTTFNSYRSEVLDGALARLISIIALHPLDVAKSRAQVRTVSFAPSMQTLMHRPVWPGVTASVMGHVPAAALSFLIYTTLRKRTSRRRIPCALAADALAALWLVPFEAVKLRVAAGVSSCTLSAFKAGLKGPNALYAGAFAHMLRTLPARALLLYMVDRVPSVANDVLNNVGADAVVQEDSLRWGRGVKGVLTGGAVAGVTALATVPFDVVRTRVMAQRVGAASLHSNFLTCFWNALRKEGPTAFLKGAPMRGAYAGLSVLLFAMAFESTRWSLRKGKWLWHGQTSSESVLARAKHPTSQRKRTP